MKLKRIIALCIAVLTIMTVLPLSALAQNQTIRFSDVPSSHWAHDTIMEMTKAGMFKGSSEPVNGVGIFLPDKTMSRAEFLIVALRAAYPAEAKEIQNAKGTWWQNYYDFALEKGILKRFELGNGSLSSPMTREEMAMVMVRCLSAMGEEATDLVAVSQIADYNKIGYYYKDYVRQCFSLGLICGVDAKGTFAPSRSLTRAQAATVLCRLIDKDARIEVEFEVNMQGGMSGESVADGENNGTGSTTPDGNNPGDNNSDNNTSGGSTGTGSTNNPWDEPGAKQPKDYTWAEFNALTGAQQMAFQNSFSSSSAFEAWLNNAQGNSGNSSATNPWEKPGAKQPKDYTWAEFNALTGEQQIAFQKAFSNSNGFEQWFEQNCP